MYAELISKLRNTNVLSTVQNWFEYENILLPKCTNQFKLKLINNMEHLRISGTEPSSSSVIFSQTK